MSNDSDKQKRSAKYNFNGKWVDVCSHCYYTKCIGEGHPACPILLARERHLSPEQMVIELETAKAESAERSRAITAQRRAAQPVAIQSGYTLHGKQVKLAFNF